MTAAMNNHHYIHSTLPKLSEQGRCSIYNYLPFTVVYKGIPIYSLQPPTDSCQPSDLSKFKLQTIRCWSRLMNFPLI